MKKYTEVYLERKQVQCILVESDVDATEQEVLETAELYVNASISYPQVQYSAVGRGNSQLTSNPDKFIPDFKNWILAKTLSAEEKRAKE